MARRALAQSDRDGVVANVLNEVAASFAAAGDDLGAAYDAIVRQTPPAAGVAFETVASGDVRGEWCVPDGAAAGRAILFFHGGGYVYGSAHAYRGFASQLAARTRTATFACEYRKPPAHAFPAAFDDAVTARAWLGARGYERIVLAGDSAGGGLALALLAEPARDEHPAIVGCVVFSPWTDLAFTADPDAQSVADPVVRREGLHAWADTYLAGADPRDPRASPLYGDPHDLPPVYVQAGENEVLLADATRYADVVRRNGGMVRVEVWEGLFHVFQRRVAEIESARVALDDAAAFIDSVFATVR